MKSPPKKWRQDSIYKVLKYSGLSFQLFAVIGAGAWFGWWLDKKSQMQFPLWLLVFIMVSMVVAFYHLFISLKNDEEDDSPTKKG